MISTLRSINSLLNQYDELTKFHSSLLTDFDTNFSDVKNPLRHVTRTIDEQEKTAASILFDVDENNNLFGSIGPLEDFHRRILKSRFLHRPPNYSSNEATLFTRRASSVSSSTATESVSLSKIALTTISNNRITKPKVKNEPKSTPRRQARSKVTAFTMETVNRLSKPKRYNRISDEKSPPPRPVVNVKKEVPKDSRLPPIKRTKTNIENSSSKKLKIENKIPIQTSSKTTPARHFLPPLVLITSIPPSHPNVPIQTQKKLSPLPKIPTKIKRSTIPSKT